MPRPDSDATLSSLRQRMPSPNRSLPGLWPLLAAGLVGLLALGGGWWLGQRQSGTQASADPKLTLLSKEATRLRLRLDADEAGPADRQRLLELLVALDRKAEAIGLLEPMADREPERWSLRLMLAELRRDQGDRSGAERELRQILNLRPTQVEALQLLSLLNLEQGRGAAAEARVKAAYDLAIKPDVQSEALGIGLLLAELQLKRDQAATAAATYLQLANFFPQDQRPLLGLAMLRHDQGDGKGAQEALAQARLRTPNPDKPDPRLDKLAASWGLEPLRSPSAAPKSPPVQASAPSRQSP
jgi:tetratricopeptide (TPR) repeat protein